MSNEMAIMVETKRLILRPYELSDAEAMHAVFGDPQAMKYIGDGTPEPDIEATRRRIPKYIEHQERYGHSLWVAIEKETGQPIGDCGLFHLEGGPTIEVGYRLMPSAWGKGYATEAARASVEWGFQNLDVDEIVGVTLPNNFASQHVLTKVGLTYRRMGYHWKQTVTIFAIDRPR